MQTQKTCFLQKFAENFLLFFSFFAEKTLKITISTSVLGAQHPNAGQNIQQLTVTSVWDTGEIIDKDTVKKIQVSIYHKIML